MDGCPFCERLRSADLERSRGGTAVVIPDRFPVSAGHQLVVPERHISRPEELTPEEWNDLFSLVRTLTLRIAARADVDGVNVGFNSGTAAGQTVDHAHVHVIPRRQGDVPDPRGGVRHVIAERAVYWTADE
jgi:ATP adenylyltransferase